MRIATRGFWWPDDPGMPPWVHGRIDSLMVAIYEKGKQYIEKP